MATNIANAGKFWKYSDQGILEFATQSSTVEYSNITNFPQNYPSFRVLIADGSDQLLTLRNMDSSNTLASLGDNKKILYVYN
jgi:hypothetical protein